MFANLKNKLIEEVKASPSKFQQFASAAQAAVSSSSSTTPSGSDATNTTNENFFSITEEDTPQNSPYKPLRLPAEASHSGRSNTTQQYMNNGVNAGAVPRTRRLSNSSMASDISFRLPAQDSAHNIQSDLDVSASEVEDTTSSVTLETITKEQLYNAYKKSLDRYNKYRCRYTDLAKKYKDLERDSARARSVLVETQEKAIRRISELREQCTLEQQAKAHLEEALRMEMDDMQCKMQAYQTKLQLLGENPEKITAVLSAGTSSASNASKETSPINLDAPQNDDGVSEKSLFDGGWPTHGSKEDYDDAATKLLQQQLVECELKLKEVNGKYEESLETIQLLRKQEEENALSLAQTKQDIYSELAAKDGEVKLLQDNVKTLQSDLQEATREKMSEHEAKKEMESKIMDVDHSLSELKEKYRVQKEALSAAEENLITLKKESERKLSELQQQCAQLNETMERYQRNEVSLAEIDNELNQTRNENDILKAELQKVRQKLQQVEKEAKAQKDSFEREREESRANNEERIRAVESKLQNYVELLEASRAEMENERQKTKQLQAELEVTHNDKGKTVLKLEHDLNSIQKQLSETGEELKTCTTQLAQTREQHEDQQAANDRQSEEIEKLKEELNMQAKQLEAVQAEAKEHEEQSEREKNALKEQFASILSEIGEMEQQMHTVKQSHVDLEREKRALEEKIENILADSHDENHWQEQLDAARVKLAKVEEKLQNVESENSQLAEKNCLLVENSTRLEKLIAERQRQQGAAEEAAANEMRAQLEVAEATVQKLNSKLTQVLDENSRMHNAQELMEHDCRSLQDKCDALEKEKLAAIDNTKCLESQMQELKDARIAQVTEVEELVRKCEGSQQQLEMEQRVVTELQDELAHLKQRLLQTESEASTLRGELQELQVTLLREKQQHVAVLEEKEQSLKAMQKELDTVNGKFDDAAECLERANEELALLRHNNETLNEDTKQIVNELEKKEQELSTARMDLETMQQELQRITRDLELRSVELKTLQEIQTENEGKLKEIVQQKQKRIDDLEGKTQNLEDCGKELSSLQEKLQRVLEEGEHKNEELLLMREKNSCLSEDLQATEQHLQQKLEFIKKLQREQEEYQSNRTDELIELKKKIAELNEALIASSQQLKASASTEQELRRSLKKSEDLCRERLRHIEELEAMLEQFREKKKPGEGNLANSEQLQIENEYLNKHVHQLESDLAKQQQLAKTATTEMHETRAKLKSLQCELYVLQESTQKHSKQLDEKQQELESSRLEVAELKRSCQLEQAEKQRQMDHLKYITDQNDCIQKELLEAQQKLSVRERKDDETTGLLENTKAQFAELEETNKQEVQRLMEEVAAELKAKEQLSSELSKLKAELAERTTTTAPHKQTRLESSPKESMKSNQNDSEHLRELNSILQHELEDLKHKSIAEILNLQQEIEDLQSTIKQLSDRIKEYEGMPAYSGPGQQKPGQQSGENKSESEECNDSKLRNIMQEVQDVSNRNLFLEQKCENYLILEQSNERLKLQNAKLSRQLDETLVSMQHNESITANTEFEYLRNIMFQYLTGSTSANNETLVKVISAVLKFSPQQAQVALEKEHQRRSLLNKIL